MNYAVRLTENVCGTETGNYYAERLVYKKRPVIFPSINIAYQKLADLWGNHCRTGCNCIFEVVEI